jgi:hypothetical protein
MFAVGWFEVGFCRRPCSVSRGRQTRVPGHDWLHTPSQASPASPASCSPNYAATVEAMEVPFKHPAATRGKAVGPPVEELLMIDHPFANTSLPLTRCQPDMGESRDLLSHDPNER